MKNLNHRTNSDAPSAWTKNAHDAAKRNFMGHFDAVRAGLVLLQEEVLMGGSGSQCLRRGGCDVCLQP